MDPDGYMCGRDGQPENIAGGHQAARKALEMIGQMRTRLPMATNWFRTIHRVHRYYEKIVGDYRTNTQALRESLAANVYDGQLLHRQLSLREGGSGNGGESYKLLEKTLKDFGSIEDEDVEIVSGDREKRARPALFNGPGSGDGMPKLETRSENWTAINSIVNADRDHDSPNSMTPLSENIPYRRESQPTFTNSNHTYSPQLARSRQSVSTNAPSLVSSELNPTPTSSLPPPSPYQRKEFGSTVSQHAPSQLHQQSPHQQSAQPPQQPQTHLIYSHQKPQNLVYTPSSLPPSQSPYPPLHHIHPPQDYDHSAHLTSPHSLQQPSQPSDAASTNIRSTNTNSSRFWNQEMQDVWLNSLRRPLGGDDVAAFVDGRSCEEWGHFSAPMVGYGAAGAEGWLSEVWGGVWGGGG
ncbi:hypothetical protein MMC13_000984 [Lambiella insularis]|nr:hypothetical protein [Lambiella insularis]